MKAEELVSQLELEIQDKEYKLAILLTDRIFKNLNPKDIRYQVSRNPVTDYEYLVAYPKTPLMKYVGKLMTKSLGNVTKIGGNQDRVTERLISEFKTKWESMRGEFEVLNTIS